MLGCGPRPPYLLYLFFPGHLGVSLCPIGRHRLSSRHCEWRASQGIACPAADPRAKSRPLLGLRTEGSQLPSNASFLRVVNSARVTCEPCEWQVLSHRVQGRARLTLILGQMLRMNPEPHSSLSCTLVPVSAFLTAPRKGRHSGYQTTRGGTALQGSPVLPAPKSQVPSKPP